jgi:hypothetical protein
MGHHIKKTSPTNRAINTSKKLEQVHISTELVSGSDLHKTTLDPDEISFEPLQVGLGTTLDFWP